MKKIIGLFLVVAVIIAAMGCSGRETQDIDSADDFSLPPIIDLFQFNSDYRNPFMEDFRIWGWSRDGRVAYSTTGHDGGITSLYFNIVDYFSPDSRSVSYWENFDDFNVDEDGNHLDVDGNRIDFNQIYRDFYNVCNENGIEFIQSEYRRLPIVHNNRTYNVNLDLFKQDMDGLYLVERYRLIAETQSDRFVYAAQEEYSLDVFLLGYFLSPFGNRALLGMGKSGFGGYIQDFFLGLDLDNGFTAASGTDFQSEDQDMISIVYAPENISGEYHHFMDDQPYERIILSTTERVENFAYMEIYPFIDPNDDFFLIVGELLFGLDDFTPDKPLVVITSIGSGIPSRGIHFEYNGRVKYFYITESGMDGSLQLVEFDPFSN